MKKPNITEGEWSLPHFANDDVKCNCGYVLAEAYFGSICTVSIDNGKAVSDGGNDSPPLEEAKANGKAIKTLPKLIDALIAARKEIHELLHEFETSSRPMEKLIKQNETCMQIDEVLIEAGCTE